MSASIKLILFCFLFIFISCDQYVVAVPGGKPSKSRDSRTRRPLSGPTSLDAGPSVTRQAQYRLPSSLMTPRIPEHEYNMYVVETGTALKKLGYRHAESQYVPLANTAVLQLQGLVRAQMARDPQQKKFIPLFHNTGYQGPSNPTKIYAVPIVGRDYASAFHGLGHYGGDRRQQKLALLGTVRNPESPIGPPIVELYGFAHVTDASRLHLDLGQKRAHQGQLHNLGELLDFDAVVPGTPVRRIVRTVVRSAG